MLSVCIKDQIQNMNLVIGCTVGCDYCSIVASAAVYSSREFALTWMQM